jgi:MFS family permease
MFGRRRVLTIVVAIAAVGSLLSAFGQSVEIIALGRAIQGVSGAILPLGYGLTRQLASPNTAPFWIGLLTGGYAFSAGLGYVLGGVLADLGTWRTLFVFTAAYGALLLPALFLVIPSFKADKARGKVDWVGAALFAPAVAALLYGITQGEDHGWGTIQTWGYAAVGAALLTFWIWYEARHPAPLIDVRLFRRPQIALGNLCAACASLGLAQLPVITLLILQQPPVLALGVGLGVSATVAGLLKLPSNGSALVGAPYSGWLAGRIGARWAIFQGAVIGAVAWLFMYFFHDSVAHIVIGTIIGAVGMSMIMAGLPNLVLEGAPIERSSEVTGMVQVLRSGMSGVGATIIGIILFRGEVAGPEPGRVYHTEQAYQNAMLYVAAMAGLIAVMCLLAHRRRGIAAMESRGPEAGGG